MKPEKIRTNISMKKTTHDTLVKHAKDLLTTKAEYQNLTGERKIGELIDQLVEEKYGVPSVR